jgi:hypothetical protein
MELDDEVRRYRRELEACVRLQDPVAYRRFVVEWRGLIQPGAAERLVDMDDDALTVRLAQMALEDPSLADVHAAARTTLARHGVEVEAPKGSVRPLARSRTVRLRRLPKLR